jgi:hypothetical protein
MDNKFFLKNNAMFEIKSNDGDNMVLLLHDRSKLAYQKQAFLNAFFKHNIGNVKFLIYDLLDNKYRELYEKMKIDYSHPYNLIFSNDSMIVFYNNGIPIRAYEETIISNESFLKFISP